MKTGKYLVLLMVMAVFFAAGCKNGNFAGKYAIVMKAEGNSYNEQVVKGFEKVITDHGGSCIIAYPDTPTVEDQIIQVESLISQKVDAIAIAANDVNGLQSILTKAMAEGIRVSTLDSNTNANSRQTFVNQADTSDIGAVLAQSVYDISGGAGQWAILSTTSLAANQNGWIDAMKETMAQPEFRELRLVDIAYGEDDYELSREKTFELLEKYPDLKVICAPTVKGVLAAAEVVEESGKGGRIRVTGLGMPSEMADHIGADKACPYMYLWNPEEVGALSAYVSLALVSGEITGAAGERFSAGDMGSYTIQQCSDGGTEVIVGSPLKIDAGNINKWREAF